MTSPAGASAPVVVEGLGKVYDDRPVVDGVDLVVHRGEVLGLLGPNGAGKTTTVEIVEGYRRPDAGSVRVLGLDPRRDRGRLADRIGVMLQEGGAYPALRAREALALFAAYYSRPADVDELLDRVGLADSARTPVRRLSGGQRRRLELALAVVGRPEVAFLDEPTAGMDPHARATTWEVVDELRAAGAAVLLTTHAMDEAETLADRVAVIDGGRLIATGTPAELAARSPAGETSFRAEPGLDVAGLAHALHLAPSAVVEVRPGEYTVAAAPSPELVADLAAWLRDRGVALGDLQAGRRSLHDVFVELTRPAARRPSP